MFPLFETIKVQDGQLFNLPFHEARMNRARRDVLGVDSNIDLESLISPLPFYSQKGLFKCRIAYQKSFFEVDFQPYQFRNIDSLKLVFDDEICYDYKWQDRSALNRLLAKKEDCDEVLIVKNGLLTDTSFSNIALFDGKDWMTPAEPLLKGTQRARLLKEGKLKKARITPADLPHFQSLRLINAFYDLENGEAISMDNIRK